jgi:hypothetical protein
MLKGTRIGVLQIAGDRDFELRERVGVELKTNMRRGSLDYMAQ